MPTLTHIGLLATCRAEGGQSELHLIEHAALRWEGATITWVGKQSELPPDAADQTVFDAGGKLVIPGLIDCHTHLGFAGDRSDEFVRRVKGESYLDIALSGGGIRSTVRATRAATKQALIDKAAPVLREMAMLGVTTVEAKSGYGLTLEDEVKILDVYRTLGETQPVEIVPTLLAAHTIPAEYADDRASYVRLVVEEIIPRVAREKLATACDVFIERSAFTLEEAREILLAARAHGLALRIHADQLHRGGGTSLAAELGCLSADHLEHASDDDLKQLAASGVVGVTLPLASLYTFEEPLDARRLVKQGVEVAVATDYNPGTAPSYHLPLALMLACTLNRLTPAEALKGATAIAARAVGRERTLGSIEPGKQADFVIVDAPNVERWLTHFRPGFAHLTVKRGQIIHQAQ